MTTNRLNVIPADVLALITGQTGTITRYENAGGGLNSEIAAHIHSDAGTAFVKGLRLDHRRLWTQRREAAIAPYVQGIAPALLWRLEGAGWDLNGFEDVEGRHADYSPGSSDLPRIVELLNRLSQIKAPALELRSMADRMQHYSSVSELFEGETLLHTDWFPTNVLVDRAQNIRVVDWAWAATGAPWIDAALWAVWLIKAGHTPEEAEEWANDVAAFREASEMAVAAFAEATVNVWTDITANEPETWMVDMLKAARAWAAYRSLPLI
ncbi:phosphotransferase family protein [Streptomyces sp. NPDC059835]|uniref:phosphotransferase family protein n=1 Tax=Streptomyces sp. NPDC059835 TaxID=3346967 RepID=UPI00365874B6